eukprot:GHVN01023272.1.p1 GENE.GHVN01023272.1~~GHVN01023272.1.p1  ORF type:complete len:671 (+),score=101.27 GHVN01023272.1:958-2970(+)
MSSACEAMQTVCGCGECVEMGGELNNERCILIELCGPQHFDDAEFPDTGTDIDKPLLDRTEHRNAALWATIEEEMGHEEKGRRLARWKSLQRHPATQFMRAFFHQVLWANTSTKCPFRLALRQVNLGHVTAVSVINHPPNVEGSPINSISPHPTDPRPAPTPSSLSPSPTTYADVDIVSVVDIITRFIQSSLVHSPCPSTQLQAAVGGEWGQTLPLAEVNAHLRAAGIKHLTWCSLALRRKYTAQFGENLPCTSGENTETSTHTHSTRFSHNWITFYDWMQYVDERQEDHCNHDGSHHDAVQQDNPARGDDPVGVVAELLSDVMPVPPTSLLSLWDPLVHSLARMGVLSPSVGVYQSGSRGAQTQAQEGTPSEEHPNTSQQGYDSTNILRITNYPIPLLSIEIIIPIQHPSCPWLNKTRTLVLSPSSSINGPTEPKNEPNNHNHKASIERAFRFPWIHTIHSAVLTALNDICNHPKADAARVFAPVGPNNCLQLPACHTHHSQASMSGKAPIPCLGCHVSQTTTSVVHNLSKMLNGCKLHFRDISCEQADSGNRSTVVKHLIADVAELAHLCADWIAVAAIDSLRLKLDPSATLLIGPTQHHTAPNTAPCSYLTESRCCLPASADSPSIVRLTLSPTSPASLDMGSVQGQGCKLGQRAVSSSLGLNLSLH